MNSSDIDINELRRNNVEFLIKKYKEGVKELKNSIRNNEREDYNCDYDYNYEQRKWGIHQSVLMDVIRDLEISQKEWVEYEDEEHPYSQSSVRSDEYLKNKEKYKLNN